MAQLPNQDELRKLKNNAQRAKQRKAKAQAAEGKEFDTGNKAGVIPEPVWQDIKGGK